MLTYAAMDDVDIAFDLRCNICYGSKNRCKEYVARLSGSSMEGLVELCDRHDVRYHPSDS